MEPAFPYLWHATGDDKHHVGSVQGKAIDGSFLVDIFGSSSIDPGLPHGEESSHQFSTFLTGVDSSGPPQTSTPLNTGSLLAPAGTGSFSAHQQQLGDCTGGASSQPQQPETLSYGGDFSLKSGPKQRLNRAHTAEELQQQALGAPTAAGAGRGQQIPVTRRVHSIMRRNSTIASNIACMGSLVQASGSALSRTSSMQQHDLLGMMSSMDLDGGSSPLLADKPMLKALLAPMWANGSRDASSNGLTTAGQKEQDTSPVCSRVWRQQYATSAGKTGMFQCLYVGWPKQATASTRAQTNNHCSSLFERLLPVL